jgi:adhesion G protein-coupled receptor L1
LQKSGRFSGHLCSNIHLFTGGEFPASIRTGYTCEGEELEVSCGPGELIQIIRANYGRFSIAICNEEGRTHWSVNCMSQRTRHILQNRYRYLKRYNIIKTMKIS